MKLFESPNEREDGRSADQVRIPNVKLSYISNISGSCHLKTGGTSILATINGPTSRLYDNQKLFSVELSFSPESRTGQYISRSDKDKAKEISLWLEEVFTKNIIDETLTNSVVVCRIVIENDDGSVIANMVTAISLALMDANIPIRTLLFGLTFGFSIEMTTYKTVHEWAPFTPSRDEDKQIERMFLFTDLTAKETSQVSPSVITIVYSPFEFNTVATRLDGKIFPRLAFDHIWNFAPTVFEIHARDLLNSFTTE